MLKKTWIGCFVFFFVLSGVLQAGESLKFVTGGKKGTYYAIGKSLSQLSSKNKIKNMKKVLFVFFCSLFLLFPGNLFAGSARIQLVAVNPNYVYKGTSYIQIKYIYTIQGMSGKGVRFYFKFFRGRDLITYFSNAYTPRHPVKHGPKCRLVDARYSPTPMGDSHLLVSTRRNYKFHECGQQYSYCGSGGL